MAEVGCPAYAGMDLDVPQPFHLFLRLPRLRGDGPISGLMQFKAFKAAPPTRGWTLICYGLVVISNGCPAYAGMDPTSGVKAGLVERLPRLRGDGPRAVTELKDALAAAPPTRGWTRVLQQRRPFRSGCPAYAGMDPD